MEYNHFLELLRYGEEFRLYYKEKVYNISQNISEGEIYFTLTHDKYYIFKTYEELLSTPLIENKTLFEIWDKLEVY